MRTFDTIYTAMRAAATAGDVDAFEALAAEVRELGITDVEGSIEIQHGNLYWAKHNYPAALEHYEMSLQAYQHASDPEGMARASRNVGLALTAAGNYPLALERYRQSLELFEQLGDRAAMARGWNDMANAYRPFGDYATSLQYYRRAYDLYEELGDTLNTSRCLHGLANAYFSTGDYPAALEHYQRALLAAEQREDRVEIGRITGNMGHAYLGSGDSASALSCYERALQIHEERGDRGHAAVAVCNIGDMHRRSGNTAAALDHFRRALQEFEAFGEWSNVAHVTESIITTLLASGEHAQAAEMHSRQNISHLHSPVLRAEHLVNRAALAEHAGNIDEAREHLTAALNIVLEAGSRGEAADYHKRLRDLAQKANNFADYIKHNDEHSRITEEIRGVQASQRLAMVEADRKMDSERRERDKERALLYGALPQSVAERMIRGERVTSDHFPTATVIFLDIVGFTSISDRLAPGQVVHMLEQIFSTLDAVCKTHSVTKIKTIGDCYMAVGFSNAQAAAQCAVQMRDTIQSLRITVPEDPGQTSHTSEIDSLTVRIGMHYGPITAGVIGTERLQYDVWGDTVNVASRMESTGQPGRIHVSSDLASQIADSVPSGIRLIPRGEIDVKGKGLMATYWLE